jgi:hypothetical protein
MSAILRNQNHFEKFAITFSDFPTEMNYWNIKIQIISKTDNTSVIFNRDFISLYTANLLTSTNEREVLLGIESYKDSMNFHIKLIEERL